MSPVLASNKLWRLADLCLIGLVITLFASCEYSQIPNYAQTYDEKIYTNALRLADSVSFERAWFYIDSLHTLVDQNNIIDEWRLNHFRYDIAHRQHQVDKALALTDTMLDLVQKMRGHPHMQRYLAQTYLQKGDVYSQHLGLYDDAYHFYARARLIGLNLSDACLIGEYDSRFGTVLYMKGRYEEASKAFKDAFEVLSGCADNTNYTFFLRQRLLDDIALSYAKMGRHDNALVYYENTVEYIDRNGPEISTSHSIDMAKAVVYGNQAQSLAALGQYTPAESLFRKSIVTNSQVGFDQNDALLTRMHLANMYLDMNRIADARAELDTVNQLMLTISYLPHVRYSTTILRWHDGMSRYFQKIGNYREALEYRIRTEQMKDSVLATNMNLYELDAVHEFNRVANQYEIDILRAESQLRQTYLRATLALAFMLICIVVLVIYIWHKSRRNVQVLTELNSQISKQKQQLEETLNEIKIKSEEKDRILWMVAHDLRNPLGAIASLSEILIHEKNPEEWVEGIQQIRFASTNAISLISDIMSVAQGETDHLNCVSTELNDYIHRATRLLRYRSDAKGQEIIVETSESDIVIPIDVEKMTRVITNLVSNAIKFSPPGGKIWVRLEDAASEVKIHVVDRGIGIPSELQERIFDTFTTAKRKGTQGERPFGLGLSIARQIVRAHGGDIACESEEGQGSRFVITLPK